MRKRHGWRWYLGVTIGWIAGIALVLFLAGWIFLAHFVYESDTEGMPHIGETRFVPLRNRLYLQIDKNEGTVWYATHRPQFSSLVRSKHQFLTFTLHRNQRDWVTGLGTQQVSGVKRMGTAHGYLLFQTDGISAGSPDEYVLILPNQDVVGESHESRTAIEMTYPVVNQIKLQKLTHFKNSHELPYTHLGE